MLRQRPGALTAQAEHERGRAWLAGRGVRAAGVVDAGRHDGVQLTGDHPFKDYWVQAVLGSHRLRVAAGPFDVAGSHRGEGSASAGFPGFAGEGVRHDLAVLGDVATV